MGYELTFHFHEKNEDGKFNMDETKTFTKNVGRRNVEITLEQVAAVVLGQLAKRDIYITDVEIYEYAKQEISFKEVKSGIIIKGKKFNFDQLHGVLKAEDDCDERMTDFMPQFKPSAPTDNIGPMPQFNPHLVNQVSQKINKSNRDPNIPLRHEVFRPSREDYPELQRQGIKLSMNKAYPLFAETIKPTTMGDLLHYVVLDDTGNRIEVSSSYFEPMRRGLVGVGVNDPPIPQSEGKLSYVDYGSRGSTSGSVANDGGGNATPMPTLRRSW